MGTTPVSEKKMSGRPLTALVVGVASLALVTGCGEQPKPQESYAYACQSDLDHSATPSVTEEAPKADSWTSGKDGVQYPVSSAYGGCESLDSGWKVGHSHNTAGALYAATDFLAGPTGDELEHASADDLTKVYAAGEVRDQNHQKRGYTLHFTHAPFSLRIGSGSMLHPS